MLLLEPHIQTHLDRLRMIEKRLASKGLYMHTALSGGTIRDFILNKPIRDLDVYIPSSDVLSGVCKVLNEINVLYKLHNGYDGSQIATTDGIDFINVNGVLFNHINAFNCSLSKVLLKRSYLYFHREFLTSIEMSSIFITGDKQEYINKITDKYKDSFDILNLPPPVRHYSPERVKELLSFYLNIGDRKLQSAENGRWFCLKM